jgi:2-C-methyl-D-erythritol 4-phosphate cytidylyltransferase
MVSAIIVAGGKGIRMGQKLRKQYLSLAGRPVLTHTLLPFHENKNINRIYLVVPEGDFEFCKSETLLPYKLDKKVELVPGGVERQDSVYNGLKAVEKSSMTGKTDITEEIVVIHDGVRPFIKAEMIEAGIAGARDSGACITGITSYDTVKNLNASGEIHETIERDSIWFAQTPQVFKYSIIKNAHEHAKSKGFSGTDDASLVEFAGLKVKVINGSRLNIKITTKEDFLLAEAIFAAGLE